MLPEEEVSIEMSGEMWASDGSIRIGSSPAATIVEWAAYRIDISGEKLQTVLMRMEEECVREEWQLHYLQTVDWRTMGAPIGLIAAVRACLHESSFSTSKNTVTTATTTSYDASATDPDAKFLHANRLFLDREEDRMGAKQQTSLPSRTSPTKAASMPTLIEARKLKQEEEIANTAKNFSLINSINTHHESRARVSLHSDGCFEVPLSPPPMPRRRSTNHADELRQILEHTMTLLGDQLEISGRSSSRTGKGMLTQTAVDHESQIGGRNANNEEMPQEIFDIELASTRSVGLSPRSPGKKSLFGRVTNILRGGKSSSSVTSIGGGSSSHIEPRPRRKTRKHRGSNVWDPPQLPIRSDSQAEGSF